EELGIKSEEVQEGILYHIERTEIEMNELSFRLARLTREEEYDPDAVDRFTFHYKKQFADAYFKDLKELHKNFLQQEEALAQMNVSSSRFDILQGAQFTALQNQDQTT
ncbi:9504_t:CDS:2, partial [Cetraspora pellucida]